MATVGTLVHRAAQPWGLVLALALTLAGAVLSRAWGGWGPLVAFGVGAVLAAQLFARPGPGGDVLVPAGTLGWVWLLGSLATVVLAALAPRRWFAEDEPTGRG